MVLLNFSAKMGATGIYVSIKILIANDASAYIHVALRVDLVAALLLLLADVGLHE